jgi:outer membrane receptor for ferrienterochelin and colicin
VGLALCLARPAGPVRAQDMGHEDFFGFVASLKAVTPTLYPMPVSQSPGTVTVITHEQIEQMGAATLDEVLAFQPGVDAVMSPMGFAGNIRGFGGSPFQEGVQYLIDGHLYNSPDKGGSSASPGYSSFPVPVEMIERVEIVREPISALYGPNAFFGVVNVVTKNGKDLQGGSVAARVGNRTSGRGLQRYSAVSGGGQDRWEWSVAGDVSRELGPLRFHEDSRLRDSKVNVKVRTGDLLISYLNQVSDSDPFVFATTTGPTQGTQQSVNLAGAAYSKELSADVTVFTKSNFLSRRGTNCQACHNAGYARTREPAHHREAFFRLFQEAHARVTALPKNEITIGGEFMYDRNHMESGVLGQPKLVSRTYSAFVQDVVALREDLSATLGARQDDSDWGRSNSLTNPRALLVYTPTPETTVRTGYAQAHRVPTYHDLYAFFLFVPRPGFRELYIMGNPDLEPERIQTYTAGVDHWITRRLLVKVNGFHSVVRDHIDRQFLGPGQPIALLPGGKLPNGETPLPDIRAMRWINIPGKVDMTGGEVEVGWRPSRKVEVDVNYSHKEVSYRRDPAPLGGSRVSNAPRHKAAAGVTLFPTRRLMLNVTGRYRSKFYTAFARQVTVLPGFNGRAASPQAFLTDTHLRYSLLDGVSLSLIARNVFNQDVEEWKGLNDTELATGRDLFMQLAYEFGGKRP